MLNYFKGAKGSWMWLVIRLYLGYQWMEAGWHKISGATPFDPSAFLNKAIANSIPAKPGAKPVVQHWWAAFLKSVAVPNAKAFAFLVQYGELLVGLALIVGFATLFAAIMGTIMNLSFMLSGTVSSSPNYVALQFLLVAVGGAYAGYIGVDYWFRPAMRQAMAKVFSTKDDRATTTA